jgi:hypothetical protein
VWQNGNYEFHIGGMGVKRIYFAIALLSSSAVASSWQDETVGKTQSELNAINATATSLKSRAIQCGDPAVGKATVSLEAQATRLATVVDLAYSRNSGAGERYIGQKTLAAIRPLITEARFILADALFEADCLDGADRIYRDTLSTFTGASYEAIRQRAQIGIDDIRAKRSSK